MSRHRDPDRAAPCVGRRRCLWAMTSVDAQLIGDPLKSIVLTGDFGLFPLKICAVQYKFWIKTTGGGLAPHASAGVVGE